MTASESYRARSGAGLAAVVFLLAATAVPATGIAIGSLASEPSATGPLPVFVSILPQAFFLERIGGPHVTVKVMVGPGQSPATFDPSPRQLTRLSRARAYFSIGVPMENALLPHLRRTFTDLEILNVGPENPPASAEVTHLHEDEAGLPCAENDPHVWLSPRLAKILARNVCRELEQLDPGHAPSFRGNLARLVAELDSLHAEISRELRPVAGAKMIVFHPAFGHFAAEYGLEQVAIEQGGLAPSPGHLASVLQLARENEIRAVFVQPQSSASAARALAASAGATVIELDPLAEDYLANLRHMARTIGQALSPARRSDPAAHSGSAARDRDQAGAPR